MANTFAVPRVGKRPIITWLTVSITIAGNEREEKAQICLKTPA